MKFLTTIFFTLIYLCTTAQITGKVAGWNYNTKLPAGYNVNKTYPVLIFLPGLGEVGTDPNKLILYGPHAYLKSGADPLPGWIIISLQPSAAYPNEVAIKLRIDSLAILFRIDTTGINLTGLSHGGWCSSTFVSGILNYINTVITVQGVIPDDNSPYPYGFSKFVGTGYLCFEQRLDGRGGQTVVNYINSLRPGVATFIETNFGGGGHCCWDEFYGGNGTQPSKFNGKNIYEWLASLKKGTVVIVPDPPTKTVLSTITLYSDSTYKISN